MPRYNRRVLFVLSLIQSALLFAISIAGLTGSLYEHETPAWRIQCAGQDLVDLVFVLPGLVISSLLLLRNTLTGRLVWPGVMLYLIYTFMIYCFDVHFNAFFIEYCVVLGLSVYSLVYFARSCEAPANTTVFPSNVLIKILAVYLLLISVAFYLLWLSDIGPAIRSGSLPTKLAQMQLPTNPVHVLDIALLLPLFIITGILLLRKKMLALHMAAAVLVFSVLMNLTILVLNMLEENNPAMRIAFSTLTVISLAFLVGLIRFYKRITRVS